MSAPAAEPPAFAPAVAGSSLRFAETAVPGAFVVEPQPVADERGDFTRVFDAAEFAAAGLEAAIAQCGVSRNRRAGTVRGMHFQAAPREEVKLVRCSRGAVYDVVVDLRPDSPAYLRWGAFELSDENRLMMYVPKGVAHGFQTLADDSEVTYQIAPAYDAALQRGIRHDDPAIGIRWPLGVTAISERDRGYPLLGR